MIPYEELGSALARWREKNGLSNGPSARMPKGAVIAAPPPVVVAPPPVVVAPPPVVVAPPPVVVATPPVVVATPAPAAAKDATDVFATSVSATFGDHFPTEEVHSDEGGTAITRSPYEPEAEIVYDEEDGDLPTGLHFTPEAVGDDAQPREITNEIEIEDLVDGEEADDDLPRK